MEHPPFWIEGETRPGRWVVTCDHATNRVPDDVGCGDLGIGTDDMARHIAFDIGAAGLASRLAEALDSPAIFADFSRLVIDPNRGEDDPTILMKLYDGTIIPANRSADAAERERRIDAYHRPYHAALERLAARQANSVICAIHSFTPQFKNRPPRPWHVGLLFAHDTRLSDPLLARLKAESDLCVDGNVPYSGHLPGDSIARHALETGRGNVLVEVRNDLIEEPAAQVAWADRLAPHLVAALKDADI
ncbi:MAG: N-formylglutamate amidohydrolase [Marinovum sp.]|nr:N-formylglutamate amidohydrolase [Marinovum sp.]